ncbi:MAG: DNA-3-methyladenine glycosylase [Oligoflexia bacterium]|nr:MAG: DNA-3-methyladenine glycosylase [Oligoflexia bacterium]
MKPEYWNQAIKDLSRKDPVMKKLIASYRGETLRSRGNAFETLARSIVGQQISVKAADSVWKRVLAECKKVTPLIVEKKTFDQLRACGLSERKVIYIKDLAHHFLEKKILPHGWPHHTDEEIIDQLVAVKGIGRWTAEMFLIFHLMRPNVFPDADLGLQKAIALNYKVRYPLSPANLKKFRKLYSPWASVAVWYLWRSLDPIPVEY